MSYVFSYLQQLTRLAWPLLALNLTLAQPPSPPPVTPEQRSAIVDSVARVLAEQYVFADVGKKMAEHIRKQNKQGAYKDLNVLPDFTERLTNDLRSISHDRHLQVMTRPPDEPVALTAADSAAEREHHREEARLDNYGFEKVERLSGNIGYIKFNMFYGAEIAAPTAIAAMNFVGNCDALIFDLRDNGGGNPSMIQLLTSYLYDEPQLLNTFEFRGKERLDQFWTHAYVPGPRLPDVPVYVLTSNHTFSGAEEFSYNLKNLKRGTIVGETTGGGAHPVEFVQFAGLNVGVAVPNGRAINPITGTNWEGTGVKPDLECTAAEALDVARVEALKLLRDKASDPDRQNLLSWQLDALNAKLHPFELTADNLPAYVGNYGPRAVTLENGSLFYQREQNPKRRLLPMAKHLFMVEGVDYFRVEFVPSPSGPAQELVGHYDNGSTDRNSRN